jgi:6-pyruvoyltetrahydropterin/6-carboxytetrahydropterin synthase
MKLLHTFEFSAAHNLSTLPADHKCSRVHGHTYVIRLEYDGPMTEPHGWVVDFGEVKDAWAPLHAMLDHRDLNTVLDNPTAESLSVYIATNLQEHPTGDMLTAVEVWETPHSAARYEVP